MRVFLFLFISSVAFATNVFAQDAPSVGGSLAQNSNSNADTSTDGSGVAITGTNLSSSTVPAAATITTDLKGAKSERKVKGEYLNWMTVPVADFKNSDGSASSYNWIGVKFITGETTSISVRQPFTLDYSYAKKDGNGTTVKSDETNAHVSDLFVNVGNSKFVQFAGDGKVSAAVRVYLPTGEKSRITKTMGGINLRGIASKPLSKQLTLNYSFFPTWLNQTQNGYVGSSGDMKPNVDYSLFQYTSLDWGFSQYVGFTQAAGTYSTWYKRISSPSDIDQEHYAYLDSSLSISGIPSVDLSFGLSNEINIHRPKQSFTPLRDAETTYYLILATTI